jgi:subtilisin family serine protease
MLTEKRYLVGCRNSSIMPLALEQKLIVFIDRESNVKLLKKTKTGVYVLEMNADMAEKLNAEDQLFIIEEDLQLELFTRLPGVKSVLTTENGCPLVVTVIDEETERPVQQADVYCFTPAVTMQVKTDEKGIAKITCCELPLKKIIVVPKNTFWSKVVDSPECQDKVVVIKLRKIPERKYNWIKQQMNLGEVQRFFTGKSIRIAIIDSGISPHESLVASGGYCPAFPDDQQGWAEDPDGHGTYCAGIIAGRNHLSGIAPDAEIFSVKIFPDAHFSDVVDAINWSIDNHIDIINLGFGSIHYCSQIEIALHEAIQRGIVCICAAGNHGGAVAFPASSPRTIAVSAIGKNGTFPVDSASALSSPQQEQASLFFAEFSNRGAEIDLCAPGVALVSSVPSGYASFDGTSTACAVITALSALIMEAFPEIKTGDYRQSLAVKRLLKQSSLDIGLPYSMQGSGYPDIYSLLKKSIARKKREYGTKKILHKDLEYLHDKAVRCHDDINRVLSELNSLTF